MITTAILFIVLGILVRYFKMYMLMAGYNTMSKDEKAEVDVKKLANVFRNGMFGMAIIIIIGYLISQYLNEPKIENYFLFASFIIGVPYLLIYANAKNTKTKND